MKLRFFPGSSIILLPERESRLKKHHDDGDVSPVSFPVNVARLPQRGMSMRIDADAKQREQLTVIHGLEGVDSLVAKLLVAPWKRNGVRVTGRIEAKIIQNCVVTLEPMESYVDEEIDTVFLPEDSKLGREGFGLGGEIILDAEGPDSPEVFSGDTIDVGALAEQFFGLGIDPYPRKATASKEPDAVQPLVDPDEGSVFANKLRDALSKK